MRPLAQLIQKGRISVQLMIPGDQVCAYVTVKEPFLNVNIKHVKAVKGYM